MFKPCLYIVIVVLLVSLHVPVMTFSQSGVVENTGAWLTNDDMLLYLDAITKIQHNALYLPPEISRETIVRESLKSYVKTIDPFAEYLSPEEYAAFKNSQNSNYSGVGLAIERDPAGRIVCFPSPGGSAEKAGIRHRDTLKAINGKRIGEKSIFEIVSLLRGEENSIVTLMVERENQARSFDLKRISIHVSTVTSAWRDDIPILGIAKFTQKTPKELRDALDNLHNASLLILDLRGNPGGDLHSAIDAAMLFLPKGAAIITINTRKEVKSYKSTMTPVDVTSNLYVWQDEYTASAAEVFVAALTHNDRAQSIGRKSYGKGVQQDIFELIGGSALILTTGYMQTPDGMLYDERGFEPDYAITSTTPTTDDYIDIVKTLTGQ